MFDAAVHYEAFVGEEPESIAIGRVSTEDLVAHVLVLGQRHRRTPDLRETSCGVPIHSEFYPPLREALTHRDTPGGLCTDCFTPHEILRAMQADADAINAEDELRRRRELEEAAQRKSDTERWAAFRELHRKRKPTEGDR